MEPQSMTKRQVEILNMNKQARFIIEMKRNSEQQKSLLYFETLNWYHNTKRLNPDSDEVSVHSNILMDDLKPKTDNLEGMMNNALEQINHIYDNMGKQDGRELKALFLQIFECIGDDVAERFDKKTNY